MSLFIKLMLLYWLKLVCLTFSCKINFFKWGVYLQYRLRDWLSGDKLTVWSNVFPKFIKATFLQFIEYSFRTVYITDSVSSGKLVLGSSEIVWKEFGRCLEDILFPNAKDQISFRIELNILFPIKKRYSKKNSNKETNKQIKI